MNIRMLPAVLTLMGALAAVEPASSLAAVNVDIRIAPPVAPVEIVPGPRAGFVWVPGFWEWRGHRHFWVRGHWIRARRGFHFVPAHWERRGPVWHFEPGHWVR